MLGGAFIAAFIFRFARNTLPTSSPLKLSLMLLPRPPSCSSNLQRGRCGEGIGEVCSPNGTLGMNKCILRAIGEISGVFVSAPTQEGGKGVKGAMPDNVKDVVAQRSPSKCLL